MMGLFTRKPRMDDALAQREPNAQLIDVRTAQEYRAGHVPQSVNVPLDRMETVRQAVPDLDAPVYVYCHSGARSAQACAAMERMGYTKVRNIGGMVEYTGPVETGV